MRSKTPMDYLLSCLRVLKLLSEDPGNYKDAPREGIRRILEEVTGKPHPRDEPVDTAHIATIRMGTTVATNALLERKGERCALVTTKGFKDLLHIGNQSRPFIFDLEIQIPDVLYEQVVEIDEQVIHSQLPLPLMHLVCMNLYMCLLNGEDPTRPCRKN